MTIPAHRDIQNLFVAKSGSRVSIILISAIDKVVVSHLHKLSNVKGEESLPGPSSVAQNLPPERCKFHFDEPCVVPTLYKVLERIGK
jgi:hypothetical protein